MNNRVMATVLAMVACWLCSNTTHAQSHDRWWGNDKALHLSWSAGISASGYAVAIPLWDEPLPRVVFAASIGLAAGIGKELVDATGRGDPSWRDLTWDVIGVALGTAIVLLWDLCLRQYPARSYRPATGRTASTGMRAVRTTFSATLPSNRRSRPV